MRYKSHGSRASLYTPIAHLFSLTCKALTLLLLLGGLLTGFDPIPAWAQVEPVCTPPPSGMVSWWPGDGATNDLIGTNHV